MSKLNQFKQSFKSSPLKSLAIILMTLIIFILAGAVTLMSVPVVTTVTSHSECVTAGGNVSGRTCEINGAEFTGPIQIRVPRHR